MDSTQNRLQANNNNKSSLLNHTSMSTKDLTLGKSQLLSGRDRGLNNHSHANLAAGNGNAADKYSEEEYSNYIDSSDVVISTYKNSSSVGLEKYFLQIEDWLDRPVTGPNAIENTPYVIEADEGVGKKTLLVKWIEYHQNKKKKYPDIILSHFASAGGNNSSYFFAIYQILNRLREALDIQQKVELVEEKLRKYFSYWLTHCSDKLEKQLKYGEKVYYDKVILIIEGVDLFIDDQYNKEANVAFWLPRIFPEHIKVIVTCDKLSEACNYFQSIGCDVLKIPVEPTIVDSMIDRHSQRQLFVSEAIRVKHLNILKGFEGSIKNQIFSKIFLCTLLPYPSEGVICSEDLASGCYDKMFEKLDYSKLSQVKHFNGLIQFILEFYSEHLMDRKKFIVLIRAFALTQKGLSYEEITLITQVTVNEWKLFIGCFKMFVLSYKGLWIMNNETLKRVSSQMYDNNSDDVTEAHQQIANVLGKHTPNSIRKLEEETYHLFMSLDYFKLKEIISTIENFLLLFNPNNKYDLCRYWQVLESQGFDPVVEYNKAIEGFEMHYHPSSQDVFRIIVQISRFLKEFSDFETYFTPEFRHPPIRGTYEELDDIGLLRELIGLEIFQPIESEENERPDLDKLARKPEEKIEIKKKKLLARNKKVSTLRKRRDASGATSPSGGKNLKPEQGEKQRKKQSILSLIESLNVDIPSSRQQFRSHYATIFSTIMRLKADPLKDKNEDEADGSDDTAPKRYADDDQQQHEADDNSEEGGEGGSINYEEEGSETNTRQIGQDSNIKSDMTHQGSVLQLDDRKNSQRRKRGRGNALISMADLREWQNMKERVPTNYYYRRWLWVQYPWACLSLKCDYSAKLKECFSSPIEYMSVKKEKEFTKQALKIAIEAKLKKQQMYKRTAATTNNTNNSMVLGDSISMIKHVPEMENTTNIMLIEATRTSRGDAAAMLLPSTTAAAPTSQSPPQLRNISSTSSLPMLKNISKLSSKVRKLTEGEKSVSSSHMKTKSDLKEEFYRTSEFLKQTKLNRELDVRRAKAVAAGGLSSQVSGILQQNISILSSSQVLERGKIFKEKTRGFDPISHVSQSQNISTVLPKLKGSINGHSNKELYILEAQALDMKRKLDSLCNENRELAKGLKEVKIEEDNQNKYSVNPEKIQTANNRVSQQGGSSSRKTPAGLWINQQLIDRFLPQINDLEGQVIRSEENCILGQLQTERLKSIIKICEENKNQNEDWINHLNYLLNNLRKMIRWEQEEMKTCAGDCDQLEKMKKEYVAVFSEKMAIQRKFISQVTLSIRDKEKFDFAFNRVDSAIEESAYSKIHEMKEEITGQETLKRQREKQSQLEKNSKNIFEQLSQAKEKFQKLSAVIDITDPQYASLERFQNFLAAMEKRNDLTSITLQREDVLESLREKLHQSRQYSEIVKKAYVQAATASPAAAAAAAAVKTEETNLIVNQNKEEVKNAGEKKEDKETDSDNQKTERLYEGDRSEAVRTRENELELKQSEYQRLQDMRMSAFTEVQVLHARLAQPTPTELEKNIQFNEDLLVNSLQNKLDIIKQHLSAEEFQEFNAGRFDRTKIHKALVKDVGRNAYDEEDDTDIQSLNQ